MAKPCLKKLDKERERERKREKEREERDRDRQRQTQKAAHESNSICIILNFKIFTSVLHTLI